MSDEERGERWYAELESEQLGDAIADYLALWQLNPENTERCEALGFSADDFEAVYKAFVQGIEKMGYEGVKREAHLLLLGLGTGRALGYQQAFEALRGH